MRIYHEAEPAQDHAVGISLEYALSESDQLIGASPDQRYEEMRRQLLAGPLKNLTGSVDDLPNTEEARVHLHMDGNHYFHPETKEVSGQILLQGVISGHDKMSPEEMLAAAQPHFVKALAQDMDDGLRDNLSQHAAQKG